MLDLKLELVDEKRNQIVNSPGNLKHFFLLFARQK